jgi:hypothetical protein
MRDTLHNNALELQKTMKNEFGNSLSGICYLLGHCLTEIFKNQGYNSRCTTGTLALLINNQNKYAKYGRSNSKGELIGNYHTWCEVEIDGKWFIVDPSLKYNTKFLKSCFKIKIDRTIPGILISSTPVTYYYRYVKNDALTAESKKYLNIVNKKDIKRIIKNTLTNIEITSSKNCA